MTDQTTTAAEPNEWGEWGSEPAAEQALADGQVAVGEVHVTPMDVRENHVFTLSVTADGKSPMLVIRADSAAQLNQRITECEMAGVWANIAAHAQSIKAHGIVGAGLGHVTPVPQPQAAPQVTPQGIPMNPQAQFGAPLGAGGVPGTAPATWQNAGAPAPAPAGCQGVPAGWFKVSIPFSSRAAGDAVKEQLKAQGLYQGNVRWCAPAKHWHVSGQVAPYFQQFGLQQ